MANLNKVFLIGNLTRDPELRYVPSGTAVTSFGLAVNRVYNTQAGEKKEDTCFMQIVTWGRRAELCGEYLSKGSPIFVEGRLQSRNWEDSSGQKRTTIEVVANNIQFLGRGKRAESKGQQAEQGPSPETDAAPVTDGGREPYSDNQEEPPF
jgi:single-strand DNA-binding protein